MVNGYKFDVSIRVIIFEFQEKFGGPVLDFRVDSDGRTVRRASKKL